MARKKDTRFLLTVSLLGSGFFMPGIPRDLSQTEKEIYNRNILLPEIGESGQSKLLAASVLVVGLGGLGSPAAFYLAAAGVGEIGIVDADSVSLSNLQRQILHGRGDVGKDKIDSAAGTISRLNPDTRVRAWKTFLGNENARDIVAPYDFVVEATDNFESKFLVNDTCVRLGIPFSHAGVLGGYGQAMTIVPGEGPCFRCIFEEVPRPGTYDTPDRTGVLGSVAGVMGAIQATEALKSILGIDGLLVGRLLTWDALRMTFREVRLPTDRRCKVCDSRGTASGTER